MQNPGSAPLIDINSPGEPRFVTFYQALESASIRNENLDVEDVSQQQKLTGVVTKVDPNATVSNGASNDIANNNDTTASIAATITSSPDTTTIDITTVQSADNSLTSRLGAESSIDDNPEIATTTIQISATPDTNGRETTPVPVSKSPGTTISINTITNTPLSDASVPQDTTGPFTTIETVTDVTLTTLSSMKSVSDDVRFPKPINTNTETTEISLSFNETMNASVSILASQNLQTASDISDTTVSSPVTESVIVMHISPETIIPATNDTSEIETNTVQQSDETTSCTTETTDTINDIEMNTIQQFDAIVPQTTKTTSIANLTTEEISNDIIEIRATAAPVFTSTYHTRLIDYAQDILSHLSQKSFSTVKTPTTGLFELFNAIPGSLSANQKTENPVQPEETTTVHEIESETKVSLDVDVELLPITTNGPEVSTRHTVDLNNVSQDQSNNQETNARNILDSSITTRQTSNTVHNVTSDFKPMTIAQDMREEITTRTSQLDDSVMENEPRSSNDTLLAELMTIAKTLFTEAMNDTRQSTQTDDMVGNDDKNRSVSSNDTSEATTAPSELSKSLESTVERIDVIVPNDLFGNEREDNSTRGPVVGSKISLVESNARPTDVQNPIDVGDIITMSFSQIKTETPNIIMVTDSMSSELTTNMPDSQLSNPIESYNNIKQQTITTTANNKVELSNRLLEFVMDFITNNPLTNSVTMNTERITLLPNVNMSMMSNIKTSVAMTEINVVQTNAVDTTNQTPEPITIVPAFDLQVTNDQSLVANASDIATILPTISDIQSFGRKPLVTESIRNLVNSTDITINRFNDITTDVPQTLTDLVSEMPNLIARLQDTTTTTTAQGTAGSRFIQPEQTTETIITTIFTIPNVTASSTISTTDSTAFPISSTDATTTLSSSIESTITTTTTMSTTAFRTTSTERPSQFEFTTTIEPTITTVDINENLVSTETTTDTSIRQDTMVTSIETEDFNAISRVNDGEATTMTSAAPSTNTSTTTTIARTTVLNRISPSSAFTPFDILNTGPYPGRFDGSQMTSIPKFSSSKAPIRDYLIYGIYPNKTIVRKRPEDNLIDGRNVNSPYVIFGIYPDGRLVRKFPNGTIIPDSSRNPVEVVFTLKTTTTTTTNRPSPRPYYYNWANQASIYNNQYQAPVYNNDGRPMDELTGGAKSPGSLDFGFINNAIGITPGGPNFVGPFDLPASVPSANKMVSLSHLFIKILILYAQ